MFNHTHKIQKSDSLGLAASLPKVPGSGLTPLQLQDNRPITVAQRKIQKEMTNSNPTGNSKVYQRMINNNSVVQRNNDYTGTGSTGPHEQGWMDWAKEKAHGALIAGADYVRHHKAGLASTGVEVATHTVDILALNTVFNELKGAMSGLGKDVEHGDIWSIVNKCVDASAAAIRGGASIAMVTHGWGEATGIPLVGDVAWYGSGTLRDKINATIRPYMLKSINHKAKIGKLA